MRRHQHARTTLFQQHVKLTFIHFDQKLANAYTHDWKATSTQGDIHSGTETSVSAAKAGASVVASGAPARIRLKHERDELFAILLLLAMDSGLVHVYGKFQR